MRTFKLKYKVKYTNIIFVNKFKTNFSHSGNTKDFLVNEKSKEVNFVHYLN